MIVITVFECWPYGAFVTTISGRHHTSSAPTAERHLQTGWHHRLWAGERGSWQSPEHTGVCSVHLNRGHFSLWYVCDGNNETLMCFNSNNGSSLCSLRAIQPLTEHVQYTFIHAEGKGGPQIIDVFTVNRAAESWTGRKYRLCDMS